jgi:adenosylhomocysteine nucleosidase
MPHPPIAIATAMHEELRALVPSLEGARSTTLGGREFLCGRIEGRAVVLVRSGIGKVAATITATLLMQKWHVKQLVFTGVAGGLGDGVRVGDVVVARQLLQHDMDASPLFPRFEIPLTGRARFDTDPAMTDALSVAARRWLACSGALPVPEALRAAGLPEPRVHEGLIVSGDRFIASALHGAELRALLPDALAVEMEGAAVAQACAEFGCRFAVLRTVSDRADDTAHIDFTRFVDEVASVCTREIVARWLREGADACG